MEITTTEDTEMASAALKMFGRDVDGDDEFADLCNRVLAQRYPEVSFCDPGELNRLVRGNNWRDVSEEIDYEAVWASDPETLAAELGA
jgi:hypothetical protein